MKRVIFLDEEECSWHCDLETMTVIDQFSEIKGQPIPETWKQLKFQKANLSPNRYPSWDVIHGRKY